MLYSLKHTLERREQLMAFDGFMTRAVVRELSELLTSGRILKIQQPFHTELTFTVRANRKNYQLLLSANANFARIHITNEKYDNPASAPMFCMFLRKHIEGSVIEKIEQIGLDRIILFHLRVKDEIGDESEKKLYVEIMGRHSNITLVSADGIILECIKHVPPFQNSYRTMLPGHKYVLPPEQKKVDPFSLDEDGLLKKVDFNAGKMHMQLVEKIAGLSPQLAKEIVFQAGPVVDKTTLPTAFFDVIKKLERHEYTPVLIEHDNKERFSMIPLQHLGTKFSTFSSFSQLLDRFYFGKAERDRVKQQAADLERFLRNEWQKNKTKVKKLEKTLIKAEESLHFQKLGELLTANLHLVKRGDTEIDVVDYYDEEGKTITIPLDPQKTPAENAQHYFKQYTKAKNSIEVVKEQIEQAKVEIDYFDRLIQQMESAAPKDVEEIREELMEEGYLKSQAKKRGKKKQTKPELEHYRSSTGIDFYVGKNNKQNDYLTNRFARQDDIWLHTKDIPGSHVVIRDHDPDEQTLIEAATVAAFFSKAKLSSSVPVDYTKIRYVKKPSGAKPGFVTYDHQSTIYVTPDEDIVRTLKVKN